MEIPKDIENEIIEYCRVNDILDINDYLIRILKTAQTIEKYGNVPQIQVKEKIVEKIVEIPKEIEVIKYITNDEQTNELTIKITELENKLKDNEKVIVELNQTIAKLKLTQRRDIYDED